jgi:large subunit ribosomal protein L9
MKIKVILRQDVKGLGHKGDQAEVAEGYGRNFLLPGGLAILASQGTIKEASLINDAKAKKEAHLRHNAEDLAARLQGMAVTLKAKAGDGGKLYGAITSKDIALALERQMGKPVDKRKVELAEPIKSMGSYPVQLRLYPGVQVEISVSVTAE